MKEYLRVTDKQPQTDHMYTYAERYRQKIWSCRGARFVASRRLYSKNYASQLVLSFFSLMVIATGIALLVLPSDYKTLAKFFSVLSIDASVFILVLSNLEFAKNYAVHADRMFKGAQALSPLHDEIEKSIYCKTLTQDNIVSYIKEYNKILNEFEVNHEEIDYLYFQATNPDHFHLTKGKRLYLKIRLFSYIWSLYIFCIVVPPVLIGLIMYGLPLVSHLLK